jgi:hypothetical protein
MFALTGNAQNCAVCSISIDRLCHPRLRVCLSEVIKNNPGACFPYGYEVSCEIFIQFVLELIKEVISLPPNKNRKQ